MLLLSSNSPGNKVWVRRKFSAVPWIWEQGWVRKSLGATSCLSLPVVPCLSPAAALSLAVLKHTYGSCRFPPSAAANSSAEISLKSPLLCGEGWSICSEPSLTFRTAKMKLSPCSRWGWSDLPHTPRCWAHSKGEAPTTCFLERGQPWED